MSRNALPPHLAGALYIAAGTLFLVGAAASGRIAFTGVGVAFIGLGVVMIVRRRGG